MFGLELYATARQLMFLDGMSRRAVARRLGISRDRVAKMCRYAARLRVMFGPNWWDVRSLGR